MKKETHPVITAHPVAVKAHRSLRDTRGHNHRPTVSRARMAVMIASSAIPFKKTDSGKFSSK